MTKKLIKIEPVFSDGEKISLELEGKTADIERAIRYLERKRIRIKRKEI